MNRVKPIQIQSTLEISKLMGLFYKSLNYPKKSPQCLIMVGESNKNVFLIQIDALSFTEFEIFEFEISTFDCMQPDNHFWITKFPL